MTTIHHPRPRSLVLVVTLALAVLALATPAWAGTSTSSCSVTWGSLAKGGTPLPGGRAVAGVRAGIHQCYDRLVVDVAGTPASPSWAVGYVPSVTADASGLPVPLRGGAFLRIALGADGTATVPGRQLADVTGFPTFRQVAGAGAFEGVSSIGLGVRARLPFRVFTLAGIPGSADGARVVVDVAHHW